MGDLLQNSAGNKISHHTIREQAEQKNKERKRNILFLIHSYLVECHLETTADTLVNEAHLLPNYEVCDNVDLDTILQDYTSYYFAKFGKYPRICKKSTTSVEVEPKKKTSQKTIVKKAAVPQETTSKKDEFNINVRSLSVTKGEGNIDVSKEKQLCESSRTLRTVSLQPLEDMYDYEGDWKDMYDLICKEVVPKNLNVKWSNCIGLNNIIDLLQEAVIYPLDYPEFFTHVKPWKGIMLYGPPGTGKTLLAKALACEARTIFINVTASTFVSKWRGESEKLIRLLFDIAKHNRPCTIFIDELDALSSRRDENQHEASRRFKSELLTQMDGILESNDDIFILATSNLPWEVDSAILRRFDKKIMVDLPQADARKKMFEEFLHLDHWKGFSDDEYTQFSEETEFFSGNDIKLICKNTLMKAVRKRIADYKNKGNSAQDIYYLVNPSVQDVFESIKNARPLHPDIRGKYVEWQTACGGI